MQGYIDEIKNIIETMPHNEFVDRLIKAIGPFYEFVDDEVNEEESRLHLEMDASSEKPGSMTSSYDMMTSATFSNNNNNQAESKDSNEKNDFVDSISKDLNKNPILNGNSNVTNTNTKFNGIPIVNGNASSFNGNGICVNNNHQIKSQNLSGILFKFILLLKSLITILQID